MFRHKGRARTLSHNLAIASLLSFVAGVVLVTGLLGVDRLTTNVTGHFAFLIDEIYELNFHQAFNFLLYILFFFLGSMTSAFIVEFYNKKSEKFIYIIPAAIEVLILAASPILYYMGVLTSGDVLAFLLLFAMGLQNSLVTTISNSVVRTTHLTGLFTDLGIECAQLFFIKAIDRRRKLMASIRLRLTIITFFFSGGVVAGIFFNSIKLYTLLIAASVLTLGIVYDYIKIYLILGRKKFRFKRLQK